MKKRNILAAATLSLALGSAEAAADSPVVNVVDLGPGLKVSERVLVRLKETAILLPFTVYQVMVGTEEGVDSVINIKISPHTVAKFANEILQGETKISEDGTEINPATQDGLDQICQTCHPGRNDFSNEQKLEWAMNKLTEKLPPKIQNFGKDIVNRMFQIVPPEKNSIPPEATTQEL